MFPTHDRLPHGGGLNSEVALMVSPSFAVTTPKAAYLQARFLSLLPRIEKHACISFRDLKCAVKRDDCIAETVALCWKWFVSLAQQGKDAAGFASAMTFFAVRSVRSGRRMCGQEAVNDVFSPVAQQKRGFKVESLPTSNPISYETLYGTDGCRRQSVIEERLHDNTVTPVPEQAAFRVDFAAWLKTLTARERRIIRSMAKDERTSDLSRKFEVSQGRISQLRRAFAVGWKRYCGEADDEESAALA